MTWLQARAHMWLVPALAAGAVALRMIEPSDERNATICPTRQCFGVSCPGCGMTRAISAMLRGDLAAMWAYHPLAPLIAVEITAAAVLFTLTATGRLRFDWLRHGTVWLALHIPLLGMVWLLRLASGTLPPA